MENEKKLLDAETEKTAKELAAQPKVHVRIPKNELNEDDCVVPVSVNGYNYFINRGESVEDVYKRQVWMWVLPVNLARHSVRQR